MSNYFEKELRSLESRAAGTHISRPYSSERHRGIRIFVEVTDKGASGTLVVKLQVMDPASKVWHDLPSAATASITTVSSVNLTVYPGIAETANVSVSDALTGPYRIHATVGANAVIFGVGAVLIP